MALIGLGKSILDNPSKQNRKCKFKDNGLTTGHPDTDASGVLGRGQGRRDHVLRHTLEDMPIASR